MRGLIVAVLCIPLAASATGDANLILNSIQIGKTKIDLMKNFGENNFQVGGPDSDRSNAYEVLGPQVNLLQEGLNNSFPGEDRQPSGIFIFERGLQSKIYRLVYASFELNQKSMVLEKKILLKKGFKNFGLNYCWYSQSTYAALIPPEKARASGYLLIMEPSKQYLKNHYMSGNWINPKFKEFCKEN